jgi:hypothetical protein
VGARGAAATALCGLNNPISELHAGGGPPRRATSGVAAPCVPPRRLLAATPSGAHQHAHPAPRHTGGSAACAAPCPRASKRSPVKFGRRFAQLATLPWRPRDSASPAFGARFRRCGGHVCALDRTKCQAGGWLAFGPRKCGWLRALTPPVCACVLVAVEMPLSSTFSAAAGATELLRGYKVAQKISLLAFSNVAEQGIGSRGHALAVGPAG